MHIKTLGLIAALTIALPAHADLIGAEVTLQGLAQLTATGEPVLISAGSPVTVSAASVEFPSVASFSSSVTPPFPGYDQLVNDAIDVGGNFISFDFANAGSGTFSSGYQNTYVFTFTNTPAIDITGAQIDAAATTLGLAAQDVTFSGNQLWVDMQGLTFNPTSFVEINLAIQDAGPLSAVPLPVAFWLFASALGGLGIVGMKRSFPAPANC